MANIKELENAIEFLEWDKQYPSFGQAEKELLDIAIKALQEKLARENPKPLTLEKLK